ncbi:MAG: CapA family protein [Chloroflexi bacterium]|nr:CapA family protein [Chloroflexota bacterium]
MSILRRSLAPLLLAALTACSAGTQSSPSLSGIHPTQTIPETATVTPSPIPTETPQPTATPTITTTPLPSLEPSPVTLMAVGDIMLARTVGERILDEGPGVVFANVQTILSTADILAGNIECAITDQGQPEPKSFTFAAPPISAQALGLAGFDIAVLGNNHSFDYGQSGMAQTMQLLDEQGIASLGVGVGEAAPGPLFIEKNGLRLAFLSYVDVPVELSGFDARDWIATDAAPGIAWAIVEDIHEDVSAAKQQADVVIVFMHFGYEGNELPVRFQRDMAVAAIDAGAAAVIGSHPHLLQHVEEYHGALIAYSLGNFVFDDFDMPENRSVILSLLLDQSGMLSYDWFPVVIINGLPHPATPEQSTEILRVLAP